jgi:hypothetical protein
MLKRADSFGINKLVRKSSVEGRALARSSWGSFSGSFFPFFSFEPNEEIGALLSVTTTSSLAFSFFVLLKRFMVTDEKLPPGTVDTERV